MVSRRRGSRRIGRPAALLGCGLACLAGCAAPRHRPPPATGPWATPSSRPWLTSRPASRPAVAVSTLQVRTLPSQNFLYLSARVDALSLQRSIEGMTATLERAAADRRVAFAGPCVFVFLGRAVDLQKPFTLEVGFPVADNTRAVGGFRVRRLEAFRCAAVTLSGPGALIDKAYDVLDPAVESLGLQRTDETREVYEKWYGPDSPDDRVLVGIGVR